MALAIVIFALVVGSVIFHFASPWWFTDIISNWQSIDTTILITFWVTGTVFVILNVFLAYCVYKFRHRSGQKAAYEPENHKLEGWLSAITTVGVVAMLAPGLFCLGRFCAATRRRNRIRSSRPAVAMEFPLPWRRWENGNSRHGIC
jgi:cytochrome c oxidase subunit 2